ncbi:aryl-alcohol-oxidase from pleurotus Eryingii [Gymnopilus junonius]|uniref:pyranose dehydrogenase (acceptor) n=1 Tax=Gymnopilus junonius TaxID=109634 RepID=A0A9P5TI55_GYMJU|nr:aryl-alcohol-oxidase from pleurotus Eryingii [Gymnopilus junonius]
MEIPLMCLHMAPNTPWDWNYTTVPLTGLNGASLSYPRGHVLGGTSSINCEVYTRGSSADWDRYATYTGDSGWSWKNILPYFKKSEKFTAPSDQHNITGDFNPSAHGFGGFLSVSLAGAPTPVDALFTEAIGQLDGEFVANEDINSGSQLGFGWSQSTIDGPSGSRSSSSAAYLHPVLQRPNLHVLVNAQVSRILRNGSKKGLPSFLEVEYRVNGSGPLLTVTASKEIILSAGSINTPQILMNSGIGDSQKLSAVGIQSVNLSDHPLVVLPFLVNSTATYDDFNRNATLVAQETQVWERTRKGPFVNGLTQHMGIPIFETAPNPAAGTNSPHFEIFLANFLPAASPPNTHFVSIAAIMLTPGSTSRGSVNITSSDPFSHPSIDAGLFMSSTDIPIMREALRSILCLASAPAWDGPSQPGVNATDADIDAYILASTSSAYHVVGTSAMAGLGQSGGVVDSKLRLKNVSGVRIVDASVLPFVPGGHTSAPTYAVAERAADLIKSDY